MTSKSPLRITLQLTTFIALLTVTGCSSGGSPTNGSNTEPGGSLDMALTLSGGQSLDTIVWVLTGADGSSNVIRSGVVSVADSLSAQFDVPGIPAGNGYTISLTGESTDGTTRCSGSASFDIHSRSVTSVKGLLRCVVVPAEPGTVRIDGQTYGCAAYGAVGASPAEVLVGGTVALSASATAPNPSAITYAWSAPTGTFTSPSSATTSFMCTAPGVVTITLQVGDGPIPDGGSCDPAQSTTTLQVTCDSLPVDPVPSPASAWRAFLPLVTSSTSNLGGAGTTPDVSGHGYGATYAHGPTFSSSGMALSGTGDVAIPPQSSIPAIDLTGSYSISAWVTMTDTSGWRTFVSADGTKVSEFYLQKRSDTNAFAFALATSDTNGGVGAPCMASASTAPATNALYHLVATRDATTGLDTLYVNGAVAGTATCLASKGIGWPAATFGIGHGMYNGSDTDYMAGTISGVGLLDRVLSPAEVSALYTLGPGASDAAGLVVSSSAGAGSDAGSAGASGGADLATVSAPCDLYAAGGTPCVAAHSTVRALYAAFGGSLYQVTRMSDRATADIGVLTTGGFANSAAQDAFCARTACTISVIYDQSPNGNHLRAASGGGAVNTPDAEAIATALRLTVSGHPVYGVYVTPGVGYRSDATFGVATGDQPEGEYMVTSGKHYNSGCCFDYGNAETSDLDTGNGHMEAIYFGASTGWGSGSGSGPWVMADLENGLFAGGTAGNNAADTSVPFDFVTAVVKGARGALAIKAGDAQSGTLTAMWSGQRPTNYITMHKEGSIILGIGGDNSNAAAGSFFEGVMTSGYPSDATEDAVQANIVAAGYGH